MVGRGRGWSGEGAVALALASQDWSPCHREGGALCVDGGRGALGGSGSTEPAGRVTTPHLGVMRVHHLSTWEANMHQGGIWQPRYAGAQVRPHPHSPSPRPRA